MSGKDAIEKECRRIREEAQESFRLVAQPTLHPSYLSFGDKASDDFLRSAYNSDSAKLAAALGEILGLAEQKYKTQPLAGTREADDNITKLIKAYNDIIVESTDFGRWKKQQDELLKKWREKEKLSPVNYDKYSCVPQQADWVTFLIRNPENKVNIEWTDGLTPREASYYKIPCWWGRLIIDVAKATAEKPAVAEAEKPKVPDASGKEQPKPDKGAAQSDMKKVEALMKEDTTTAINRIRKEEARLQTYGETFVFVAAEFIEEQYAGAPHLRYGHLRDIFSNEGNPDKGPDKWAYLRLNEMFHYGQDLPLVPKFRFLVYHPFQRPRKIPQAQFVTSSHRDLANKARDKALESSNSVMAAIGVTVATPVAAILNLHKDKLRQFDSIHPSTPPYLEIMNKNGGAQDQNMVSLNPALTKEELISAVVEGAIEDSEEKRVLNLADEALKSVQSLASSEMSNQPGRPRGNAVWLQERSQTKKDLLRLENDRIQRRITQQNVSPRVDAPNSEQDSSKPAFETPRERSKSANHAALSKTILATNGTRNDLINANNEPRSNQEQDKTGKLTHHVS